MVLASCIVLTTAIVVYVFVIRRDDIPPPEAISPTAHLEERKGRIYENLRDLQFEYRVGKLSDADYQNTKRGLQTELANVMAAIDQVGSVKPGPAPTPPTPPTPPAAPDPLVCVHCGAKFEVRLRFCGECGKPMPGGAA